MEGSLQTDISLPDLGLTAGALELPVPAGIPLSTRQLGVSESLDLRPERRYFGVGEKGEVSRQSGLLGREVHDSREEQHGHPYFPGTCIVERGRATWGRAGRGNNYLDFAFRELCSLKAFNVLKKKKKSLLNSQAVNKLDKIASNSVPAKKPQNKPKNKC